MVVRYGNNTDQIIFLATYKCMQIGPKTTAKHLVDDQMAAELV